MGPGFIFPCAGGRAPFPTDFSSAGGQDYSPRLSRRLEGKLAKIREGRRRLAAQGPPNQRQGRGRNPALPLCALCAPAAPLRGFFKAPFQPRQSRASRTLPGGIYGPFHRDKAPLPRGWKKPGAMANGPRRFLRKGASTSHRFPQTLAREYRRVRSTPFSAKSHHPWAEL